MAGKRKLNSVNLEPDVARAAAAAERTKEMLGVQQDTPQKPQKAHTAALTKQARKSPPKATEQKSDKNLKPRRGLYTLRATDEDIETWRLYAKNAGMNIADLISAAVADYIDAHPLTGTQKELYEVDMQAMKAKQALRSRE